MNAQSVSSSPVHLIIRWGARVISLLLIGLVVVILIGEGGPPNVLLQPPRVQIELAAMAVMLFGLAVGLVYEGTGGLLVLLGLAVFNVVEYVFKGQPALGAFPYFALPGVLFLLSAMLERTKTIVGGKSVPSHDAGFTEANQDY